MPAEHLAEILALAVCTSAKSGVFSHEGMLGEAQPGKVTRLLVSRS